MCFSVFAAENLNLRFSFYESKTGPSPPWLTPLMQPETHRDSFFARKLTLISVY